PGQPGQAECAGVRRGGLRGPLGAGATPLGRGLGRGEGPGSRGGVLGADSSHAGQFLALGRRLAVGAWHQLRPGAGDECSHGLADRRLGVDSPFSEFIYTLPGLELPETIRRSLADGPYDWLVLSGRPERLRNPELVRVLVEHYEFDHEIAACRLSDMLPRFIY